MNPGFRLQSALNGSHTSPVRCSLGQRCSLIWRSWAFACVRRSWVCKLQWAFGCLGTDHGESQGVERESFCVDRTHSQHRLVYAGSVMMTRLPGFCIVHISCARRVPSILLSFLVLTFNGVGAESTTPQAAKALYKDAELSFLMFSDARMQVCRSSQVLPWQSPWSNGSA